MSDAELPGIKRDIECNKSFKSKSGDKVKVQNDNRSSEPVTSGVLSGPFKWFVLVTYVIFSASCAMSELIFAPVPKQTAAYYGIKGKYFDIYST